MAVRGRRTDREILGRWRQRKFCCVVGAERDKAGAGCAKADPACALRPSHFEEHTIKVASQYHVNSTEIVLQRNDLK